MMENLHQKKKIMHITHALGGVQTYLEQVLTYSDINAFEFVIVAPDNSSFRAFCKPRAKYYPLKVKREVNVFSDFFLLIKLMRLINKERPDVLHVHSAKGGFLGRLAAKFSRAKVIYTPHGFSYLSFTGMRRVCFFMLECLARKWSNVLLAVSHSEANRAIFEIGYMPAKVKVIVNAIDPDNEAGNRDYGKNYRIGMIGRLTIQKNPMLFMDIAKTLLQEYPHLEFNILGAGLDDHLGKSLNEFITANNFGAKIRLLPWSGSNTSKEFIESTDIYVMTSVFEGLSYSLLEAMRSGCPCVVSAADGNSDVIQNNENGFSCIAKDTFCERIRQLINDRSLRETIGRAGREYVRDKHNINLLMPGLQELYAQL